METPDPAWPAWKRKAFGTMLLAGGGAMRVYRLWELAAIAKMIADRAPVVTVTTDVAGFIPIGAAITVFGCVPFTSPNSKLRGRRPLRLDELAVIAGLAAVPLMVVFSVVLRGTSAAILEPKGYTREIVDQGFRSHYMILRWRRAGERLEQANSK